MSDHIKGAGHSKATTLKTHQGQIVTNKKGHSEDSLSLKLTEAWVSAGLPLSALRNAKLKQVLEEVFRRPLPSADTLSNKNLAESFLETSVPIKSIGSFSFNKSPTVLNTIQIKTVEWSIEDLTFISEKNVVEFRTVRTVALSCWNIKPVKTFFVLTFLSIEITGAV